MMEGRWTRVRYVSTFRVTTIPAVDQQLLLSFLSSTRLVDKTIFPFELFFSLGTNPLGSLVLLVQLPRDRQHSTYLPRS